MLDWTDKHCRFFLRQLSPNALLYSEMVTTGALLNGDKKRFLDFNQQEQPVVLQLGGSVPADMAACAILAEQWGYAEVNINVGCPSDRVQKGRFGACLMAEPELVADCVSNMLAVVNIPISVKTRIGIDDFDDYAFLHGFIEKIEQAGCQDVIIHARKAILKGLSPKENRTIPPINYQRAYQIKQDFPELSVVVNGEINDVSSVSDHLEKLDGVMIGRNAYHDPYYLAEIEHLLFATELPEREEVLMALLPYIDQQLSQGERLQSIARHLLGLFTGQPGGRLWRRHISENSPRKGASSKVLLDALGLVKEAQVNYYENKSL